MNDINSNNPDDRARDELLLTALLDLVPNSQLMAHIRNVLKNLDASDEVDAILKGYGTLLNVIQAAVELEGTMTDRLYTGYYELTNRELD